MSLRAAGLTISWRNRFRAFKRKRLNPILQDLKWPLVGLIWIAAVYLGVDGFREHAAAVGDPGTGFDYFYRTVQLLVLQSGDVAGPIPWQLNVARFLLPLLAGYTAVNAFISIFSHQWQLLRMLFFRNHLVLCGLGERGLRLTERFLEQGYQVAVIDLDQSNTKQERVRKQGAVVLSGNAASEDMLLKSRIRRAKYLVTVCAEDGINAEIAVKACRLVSDKGKGVLTAYAHIYNFDLYNLLRGWSLSAAGKIDSFRLELFNVPARGAQLMLEAHPPFRLESQFVTQPEDEDVSFWPQKTYQFAADKRPLHVAVIGLGKLGRSLVVQLGRAWWLEKRALEDRAARRIKMTLVDQDAKNIVERLCFQYPKLKQACELNVKQLHTDAPGFDSGSFLHDLENDLNISVIYICFDDDTLALTSALKVYNQLENSSASIVVRMKSKAGLVSLVNFKNDDSCLDRIHPFSMLEETCTLDALTGGIHEVLARAIHENYVRQQSSLGFTSLENPSMVDWSDLPEALKESNRHQAARLEEKLSAIGYFLQPLTDWDAADFKFSDEEIEIMARMEHERWMQERIKQGWRYENRDKDIKRKISPHLVPWDELSEEARELDRSTVKEMARFLALAGLQVCRKR